ncbi:MAG: phage protease [Kiritimatiellales bacterium]
MNKPNSDDTPLKHGVALCEANPTDRVRVCVAINAKDGNVPDWVVLIPPGPLVQGIDGRSWTMPDGQAVAEASNSWAKTQGAPLDEAHSTQLSTKAPACGWFEEYRVASNGAIEARVDWTDLGRGFVSRREYRFISAAFDYNVDTREILCCIGGGLTNSHNLRVPALNKPNQEEAMDPKLLAALGLTLIGDPAKDLAAALNAIETLKSEKQTALNAAQTPPLDKFVPRADYDTAINRAETAENELTTIKENDFTARKETAVNKAVADGKIAPASKDYHLGAIKDETALNSFAVTFGDAAPVISKTPAGSDNPPPATQTAINAATKEVAEMMGVSEEDIRTYGGDE